MFDVVDFSNWLEYHGALEGSGRSEKIWLVSPDDSNVIGLFKYPKSKYTTEHVSEHLAYILANRISIKCAKVDLGIRNGRLGSMSYLINQPGESIIEGLSYICGIYRDYDKDKLFSENQDEYYSVGMISNTMKKIFKHEEDHNTFMNFIHKTMIFDAVIGNRDRHHSNWALLVKRAEDKSDHIMKNTARLAPLYDNGSSLCCYDSEERISRYFGHDKGPLEAMLTTKSRSCIRLDGKKRQLPTHDQVVNYLASNYRDELIDFVEKINRELVVDIIDKILSQYSDELLSFQRKRLIREFLTRKIKGISEAFNVKDVVK